jgi:uncharacterized protein (TIGR02284 family)
MSTENTIDVLNDLIRINNDRIEGYTKAEKETEKGNADLISTFQEMISQSNENVKDLRALIMKYNGTVATGTTALGQIYRAWMDVKDSLSTNERKTVLSACEFGEDAAQKAYRKALDENGLGEEARSLIALQKNRLHDSHDLIKSLRDREKVTA